MRIPNTIVKNNKVIGISCLVFCSVASHNNLNLLCLQATKCFEFFLKNVCVCLNFNTVVVFFFFCRGFGFVTFTDAASVDKVLAQQHHELDSKTVS